MKKTIVAIAALVITLSSYGQGQVHFANRDPNATPAVSEPITGVTDFTGFTAELLLVNAGVLTSLGTTTFNPAANRIGFVIPIDPVVPGVLNGNATFRFRAYNGSSFATSALYGESTDFVNSVAAAPASPAAFTGFIGHSFAIVPEPTTLALGAIGVGALLLRRRK